MAAFPSTMAAAAASHPGKPQAPQLAPGSTARTLSTRGSTSTWNLTEASASSPPMRRPEPAITATAKRTRFQSTPSLLQPEEVGPAHERDGHEGGGDEGQGVSLEGLGDGSDVDPLPDGGEEDEDDGETHRHPHGVEDRLQQGEAVGDVQLEETRFDALGGGG